MKNPTFKTNKWIKIKLGQTSTFQTYMKNQNQIKHISNFSRLL